MGRKHVILPSWSPRASSEKSEARQPSESPDMRRCARPDEGRCAWVIIPAAVERERDTACKSDFSTEEKLRKILMKS